MIKTMLVIDEHRWAGFIGRPSSPAIPDDFIEVFNYRIESDPENESTWTGRALTSSRGHCLFVDSRVYELIPDGAMFVLKDGPDKNTSLFVDGKDDALILMKLSL